MLPVTVQFIVAMLAYTLNEGMARKAEYLREENRVLKEALRAATGKTRISLTDEQRRRLDGFLRNATHLIHDRDPLYTKAWRALLKSGGVKCVPIPAHSPNCNPHAERFVKTIRTECLDQFVIFGERHLRHLVGTFVDHYLTGRIHQELGGQLVRPPLLASNDNDTGGAIQCRSRLGGLLNFYYREAA